MKDLYDEVLQRFPEIRRHLCDGDEELPYCYFNYIAWWVNSLPISEVSENIITRISNFADWCASQPKGKDASDDISTILMVALFESLGSSESGRRVLSRIWSQEYVINGQEYLRQWLGEQDYAKLLTEYHTA